MQASQRYTLNIRDLFTYSNEGLCGAEAVVAILDGNTEVDRLSFKGKVGPGGDGYYRSYTAKPGLKAKKVSGPGAVTMTSLLG
ncbi:hypothetical protein [Pseudomonas shahriarae]|uniref:hypothetical protein n=1 Tax=Pseudomonas shahriarae TaxID=2745512 RepID=UPI00235E7808|nr:hypothetical protein [Pseudomonas shahriarae]MDD1130493.1 hypothetical protein [Pseudomonas shahriarae]